MQVYALITQTINLFLGMMLISGSFSESIGSTQDDQYVTGFMLTLNLFVFILPFLQLLFESRALYIRYESTVSKVNRMLKVAAPTANPPFSQSLLPRSSAPHGCLPSTSNQPLGMRLDYRSEQGVEKRGAIDIMAGTLAYQFTPAEEVRAPISARG